MWDRLFGRGKQELPAEPTCAACGRTLLPGEWAQTIVREDGVEEVVCSLCAQTHDFESSPRTHDDAVADFQDAVGLAPSTPAAEYAPEPIAVTGRPQHSRGRTPPEDGDAQWQAIREKDAEIARLQAEVARLETHTKYLDARLAEVQSGAAWAPEAAAASQWATDQPAAWAPEAPGQEPAQWAEQPAAEAPGQWAEQPAEAPAQWAEQPAEAPGQWAEAPAPEAVRWPDETTPAAATDTWQVDMPADAGVVPVEQPAAGEAGQWPDEQPAQWPEAPVLPAAPWPEAEDAAEVTAEWTAVGSTETPGVLPPETVPLASVAAAAVTDEWTGRSQMPAEEWPLVAPLENAAGYGPAQGSPLEMTDDAPERPAIVDTPTEPLAMHDAEDSDFCPVCDTAEMPAVAPVAAGDEDALTMQIPAAVVAQQIVFEPQPEPADLHKLERGADLFNVSPMPHKVAESNELLGLPAVHMSSDGDEVTALFLWSMAWYEYRVDLATGNVVLADRGYDDRGIERPNSTTKPDGTIQLAPLPARRAVIQPAPLPLSPGTATPAGESPVTDDPQPVVPGKGDIISKSLKGQRTDDEGVAWDEMGARDFDWGR